MTEISRQQRDREDVAADAAGNRLRCRRAWSQRCWGWRSDDPFACRSRVTDRLIKIQRPTRLDQFFPADIFASYRGNVGPTRTCPVMGSLSYAFNARIFARTCRDGSRTDLLAYSVDTTSRGNSIQSFTAPAD